MSRQTRASISAFAAAACLIGSVGVGIHLMQTTGGGAASADLASNPQMLTLAEALKLASALLYLPVITALKDRFKTHRITASGGLSVFGYGGTFLLFLSGVIGLITLYTTTLLPETGALLANQLGLASAVATGVWAGLCGLFGWRKGLPKPLSVTGMLLAAVSLAMAFVPPIGLLTALLSLIWLIGLGGLFLKKT